MYSLSSVKSVINRPRAVLEEINRFYRHGFGIRSSPAHNEQGVDIISEDWDNLIILDACRFDTFEELAGDLPGKLRKVESKASSTHLFLRANFKGRNLNDTVYVTASPQLHKSRDGDVAEMNISFHDRMDVWQENWHDELRTVMPEDVTEAALEASEQYPNKRLIIHFIQPHAPYVGETGRELPVHRAFWGTGFREGEFDDLSLEKARRAYRENLKLVLPHVSELLSEFEGKTVVTADHGEALGERDFPVPIRRYGHPSYTKIPGVIEVPWLVHEGDVRPDIVAEVPGDAEEERDIDPDVVEDRLRDLGYVE